MRDRCLQSGFWCFSRHRVAKTGLIQSSPENIYLKACSSSFSWSTDCLVPDRHPALLSEAAEGQRLPRPVTAFLQNWMVSANFYSAIKIKWYRGKGWKWTVRSHLRLCNFSCWVSQELCTEAVGPLLPEVCARKTLNQQEQQRRVQHLPKNVSCLSVLAKAEPFPQSMKRMELNAQAPSVDSTHCR